MSEKSQDEKDYHEYLAQQPCCVCGCTPVHVHHIRIFGKRSSNHWYCLPLCPMCHQGDGGVHHSPNIFNMRTGGEMKLLAEQIKELWKRGE